MSLILKRIFPRWRPASTALKFFDKRTFRSTSISFSEQQENKNVLEYQPNVVRMKLVTHNDVASLPPDESEANEYNNPLISCIVQRPQVGADDVVVRQLLQGIREGRRSHLAQGITLVESTHPLKRAQGQTLVKEVLALNKDVHGHSLNKINTFRIGLSGPPGAGKSTHIETLGTMLTSRGHKVAVLAVDPSSSTSGGSLLGDKTRMLKLAVDKKAYIRPSPTCGNLGGVTRVTNDAIVLCEGAGYDVIIVETVGVGQSEFAVADMVDLFELLLPPAGGDELQGIKKGIVEVADMVVVNKSDGDLIPAARRIQMEYVSALKFIRGRHACWKPSVMRVSSVTGDGMEEMWNKMEEFRKEMCESGELQKLRRKQYVKWLHNHLHDNLHGIFHKLPPIKSLISSLEHQVSTGVVTPGLAADQVMRMFIKLIDKNLLSH